MEDWKIFPSSSHQLLQLIVAVDHWQMNATLPCKLLSVSRPVDSNSLWSWSQIFKRKLNTARTSESILFPPFCLDCRSPYISSCQLLRCCECSVIRFFSIFICTCKLFLAMSSFFVCRESSICIPNFLVQVSGFRLGF